MALTSALWIRTRRRTSPQIAGRRSEKGRKLQWTHPSFAPYLSTMAVFAMEIVVAVFNRRAPGQMLNENELRSIYTHFFKNTPFFGAEPHCA